MRIPLLLAVTLLVALALPAGPAAAAPDCSRTIPIAGARFTAKRVPNGLAWSARWIVEVDTSFDFQGGTIPLAVPLPAGETLAPSAGITPVLDDGRVRAVCVAPEALHDRSIQATFLQPLESGASGPLGAPIAAGSTVQIIDGALGGPTDPRLEVGGGPLEVHLGWIAPRAIGHEAREEARRLADVHPGVTDAPVFLRGDDVREANGLAQRIALPRARSRSSAVGVAIAFVAIVGALVLAARKLRQAATVERADALLASEIEAVAGARRRRTAR